MAYLSWETSSSKCNSNDKCIRLQQQQKAKEVAMQYVHKQLISLAKYVLEKT